MVSFGQMITRASPSSLFEIYVNLRARGFFGTRSPKIVSSPRVFSGKCHN